MIGIIPAAGNATRIGGLPKALLPIPGGMLIDTLIRRMQRVMPYRLAIGTKGALYQMLDALYGDEAILYHADTLTMSETVLKALRHTIDGEWCGFGMPDTYFEDAEAFVKLSAALNAGAQVAVGVFRTRPGQHKKLGMCRIENGQVTGVIDKPETTVLTHAWGVLAWRPEFWLCIDPTTPHVGYALPLAIQKGLDVRAVMMDGSYWDAGTPEEYFDLIRHLTGPEFNPAATQRSAW